MNKLETVIASAEFIQQSNALDCSVTVFNTEGIIIHQLAPRTFDFPAKVGDKAPGVVVFECLKLGQAFSRDVFAFGTKLRAIHQPIIEDNGQITGVLGVAVNMQTVETLNQVSQIIATNSRELTDAIEELAGSASLLSSDIDKIKRGSKVVLEEIGKTDQILKFVSDVADNSNLLGLNAAIEAARAGEQGRGFAVVADEIRKMAQNSAQSVDAIKIIIRKIRTETVAMDSIISTTVALGEQQAAATEQIGAAVHQMSVTTEEIEKVAHSI
ncbi:MAG: yfmS 10 [Firmicutes bacterium]|nr:yfmS 10 [Bacillota bacterium]